MFPDLARHARRLLAIEGPDIRIEPILISKNGFRRPELQRLTWLLFVNAEAMPRAVAHHFVLPTGSERLRAEYEMVRKIWSSTNEGVVPEPLGLVEVDGWTVLVERFVPGRTMATELAEHAHLAPRGEIGLAPLLTRHLEAVLALRRSLAQLERDATAETRTQEVRQAFERCRRTLEPEDPALAAALSDVETLLLDLLSRQPALRRVVHGDFVPSNIPLTDEGVVLLDWEHSWESTCTWFEPLKLAFFYLSEMVHSGLAGDSGGPMKVFSSYLRGRGGALGEALDALLTETGFPVQDRQAMATWWVGFLVLELNLILSVAAAPSVHRRAYARLIASAVETALGKVSPSIGTRQPPRPRAADSTSELAAELDRTRRELDRTRRELEAARRRAAELQLELTKIRQSRLWRLGSLYWTIRQRLGLH